MALNSSTLSSAIFAAIEGAFGDTPKQGEESLRKFTDSLAESIVEHITANAVVSTTVNITQVNGSPTVGATTGTGTGTIS